MQRDVCCFLEAVVYVFYIYTVQYRTEQVQYSRTDSLKPAPFHSHSFRSLSNTEDITPLSRAACTVLYHTSLLPFLHTSTKFILSALLRPGNSTAFTLDRQKSLGTAFQPQLGTITPPPHIIFVLTYIHHPSQLGWLTSWSIPNTHKDLRHLRATTSVPCFVSFLLSVPRDLRPPQRRR